MKIDWFYLNSLAEAKVENMKSMFQLSFFNKNLGAWDLENKYANNIFKDCHYSMKEYKTDRKNYLSNIELEKEKNNNKYLEDEKNKINNELNKDINLNTIEMEF